MPHEYPADALLTGPVSVAQAASTRVVVNVSGGGPRSAVEMAVSGGAFMVMRRVQRIDPFVQEVYARNAPVRKPWVKAELSSHIWQAPLPTGLAASTHRLTVRAQDEHGREHTTSMVLEMA